MTPVAQRSFMDGPCDPGDPYMGWPRPGDPYMGWPNVALETFFVGCPWARRPLCRLIFIILSDIQSPDHIDR